MIYKLNSKMYKKLVVLISIVAAVYFAGGNIKVNSFSDAVFVFVYGIVITFVIVFYNTREDTIRKSAMQSNNYSKIIEELTAYSDVDPVKLLMNMYIVNQKDTRTIIVTNSMIKDIDKLDLNNHFIKTLIDNTDIPIINKFINKLKSNDIILARAVLRKLSKVKLKYIDLPLLTHHTAHLLSFMVLDGTLGSLALLVVINLSLIFSYFTYFKLHHNDNMKVISKDTEFEIMGMANAMMGLFSYANFVIAGNSFLESDKRFNSKNIKEKIETTFESLNDLQGDEFLDEFSTTIYKVVAIAADELKMLFTN